MSNYSWLPLVCFVIVGGAIIVWYRMENARITRVSAQRMAEAEEKFRAMVAEQGAENKIVLDRLDEFLTRFELAVGYDRTR